MDAEIHQNIQIFGPYLSQLKAGKYALSCSEALSHVFGREEEGTVLGDIEVVVQEPCVSAFCTFMAKNMQYFKKCLLIPEKCLSYF